MSFCPISFESAFENTKYKPTPTLPTIYSFNASSQGSLLDDRNATWDISYELQRDEGSNCSFKNSKKIFTITNKYNHI